MSVNSFETLVIHAGHSCIVQAYADNDQIVNVSIECLDCNEVLVSYDEGEYDYAEEKE
jgi:hypothetical protein